MIQSTFQEVATALIHTSEINAEIANQLTQILSSSDETITVLDESGNTRTSYSVAFLKSEIDTLNSSIRSLSGLVSNGQATVTDGNGNTALLLKADLNAEGTPIDTISFLNQFVVERNFDFKRMMDPKMFVKLDLTNKIDSNIKNVEVRKFTIRFTVDATGTITTAGQTARSSFISTFAGKNNIKLEDWVSWYNANKAAIIPETVYEDNEYPIIAQSPKFNGVFDVIKITNDSNGVAYYTLDTLQYVQNSTGSVFGLAIGDRLTRNVSGSTTTWKILTINNSNSLPIVTLQRENGQDPISVGKASLKLVSPLDLNQTIKVPITFDEYVLLFVKPINPLTNIAARRYSFGQAFWTNDLLLSSTDSDNGTTLSTYFLDKVKDLGKILEDIIGRSIPTSLGIKPDAPVLSTSNFNVVIANSHLVNSPEANEIKQLSSQQRKLQSDIIQLNNSIRRQQEIINTKKFGSNTLKKTAETKLDNLNRSLDSSNKLYASIVSKIAQSATSNTVANPKFRLRGFFTIPNPKVSPQSGSQNVIQFVVQYKYLSPSGSGASTTTFKLVDTTTNTNVNAAFSEWIEYKTPIRKRAYNRTQGRWVWQDENYGDVDQPNITQIDLPIQPGEQIQMRIKSISEVGFPDALITSEWSNTIQFAFPDALTRTGQEVKNALESAKIEQTNLAFQTTLSTNGLIRHVQDSFSSGSKYLAHNAANIGSGFFDANNTMIDLFTYLQTQNTLIASLQDQINKSKGVLKVSLFNKTNEIVIQNGQNYVQNVIAENYVYSLTSTQNIFKISDFSLKIQNTADSSPLNLLSNRLASEFYASTKTINMGSWVNFNDEIIIKSNGYTQVDHQWIWIDSIKSKYGDNASSVDSNLGSFTGRTSNTSVYSHPSFYLNRFASSVQPQVPSLDYITSDNTTKKHTITPGINNAVNIPLPIYFTMGFNVQSSLVNNYISSTVKKTQPLTTLNRKIYFQLDVDNQTQPFTFSIEFRITNFGTVPQIAIPEPPSLNPVKKALSNFQGRVYGKPF